MAKFQERVYHDDATEKHILTVELSILISFS